MTEVRGVTTCFIMEEVGDSRENRCLSLNGPGANIASTPVSFMDTESVRKGMVCVKVN